MSERVDLGLMGLISGLKEPDLGLSGEGDERMDRQGNSPLCPTGHQPFGATAHKG